MCFSKDDVKDVVVRKLSYKTKETVITLCKHWHLICTPFAYLMLNRMDGILQHISFCPPFISFMWNGMDGILQHISNISFWDHLGSNLTASLVFLWIFVRTITPNCTKSVRWYDFSTVFRFSAALCNCALNFKINYKKDSRSLPLSLSIGPEKDRCKRWP